MSDAPIWLVSRGLGEVTTYWRPVEGGIKYIRADIAEQWRTVLERMSEGGPYEDVWIPDELHEEIQKALSDE